MTPERIAEIKARAALATPGPWHNVGALDPIGDDMYCMGSLESSAGTQLLLCTDEASAFRRVSAVESDAAFIAAARTDVEWLVARLERACELLRARMGRCACYGVLCQCCDETVTFLRGAL